MPGPALVLVEPAGPLNVGSVARLCANFGLADLRLVAPRCDHRAEEARRMAVHGADVLQTARLYPDLAAALADCHRVVAASGRPPAAAGGGTLAAVDPADALRWLLEGSEDGSALVFGREDRGLSKDELLQAGRILTIGTDGAYASLNLSHAVAVVLHELHGCRRAPAEAAARPEPEPEPEPACRAALESALADAQALLLEVGFLLPHTAHARMAKVRGLLQRAQISDDEVALLRGMVRQLRWASHRRTP